MIPILPLFVGLIFTCSVTATLGCAITNYCNREGRRADRLQLEVHRQQDQARMDAQRQQERIDAREDQVAAQEAAMALERFRADRRRSIALLTRLANQIQPSRAEIAAEADRLSSLEDAVSPADGDPAPDVSS